jgi:hypothetical protein
VDEERLHDVLAAVRTLTREDKKRPEWRVVGRGREGVLAAYAALFEPAIKEVFLIDPPVSHREGPIFLNVLRVLDIPDAIGLLAPDTSVTFLGPRDKAFDRSAEIFRRARAAKKSQRK